MHKICFTISLFHASTYFEHHVLIVRRSILYYTASAQNLFTISSFQASTCFEHYVLIVRRSKLYYTASGIITPSLCIITPIRCDDAQTLFSIRLFQACTCFEHYVLIVRRSILYYAAPAQNLFYSKFISCLYMFRAPCAYRQEGKNCIIQHLVSSHL